MPQRRRAKPLSFAALVVLGVLSLSLLASASASAAGPSADAAGTCSIGSKGRSLGPTYVTAVSVSGGATCSSAFKLVKAYYKCRAAHGVKGRCTKKVSGYACRETRFQAIAVQFSAKVTCTKGKSTVRHTYTQFT